MLNFIFVMLICF